MKNISRFSASAALVLLIGACGSVGSQLVDFPVDDPGSPGTVSADAGTPCTCTDGGVDNGDAGSGGGQTDTGSPSTSGDDSSTGGNTDSGTVWDSGSGGGSDSGGGGGHDAGGGGNTDGGSGTPDASPPGDNDDGGGDVGDCERRHGHDNDHCGAIFGCCVSTCAHDCSKKHPSHTCKAGQKCLEECKEQCEEAKEACTNPRP
jgi:hypothetical protein